MEGCCFLRIPDGQWYKTGGVLSPLLFARYIRDLLGIVADAGVGCFIGNHCMNILAYADDSVLLAPSWHALQLLLDVLHVQSSLIDLTCDVRKTVCVIFPPKNRNRMLQRQHCISFCQNWHCNLYHSLSIWVTSSPIISVRWRRYTKRNPLNVCALQYSVSQIS